MARLLWFALGAAAGLAYASQLINKERLNLPPSQAELARLEAEQAALEQGPKVDFKTKLADTLDQQADRIANLIDERVMAWTDKLHLAGHELAAKLRGQTAETEQIGVPGTIMIYGEAFSTPLEDVPGDQADTGFEANR